MNSKVGWKKIMQIEPSAQMTLPLWGLLVFILWTMFIVVLLLTVRLRHLSAGGSPVDFGDPVGNKLIWRVYRAQANCVENLPLYAGIIFLLEVRGVTNGVIDLLAGAYIGFRILHSLIHIFDLNPNFRVTCLGIQFICLLGLIINGIVYGT